MKQNPVDYICYTLTVGKDNRYELETLFNQLFVDYSYEIISDITTEDIENNYGEIYDDVLTEQGNFSIRFYVIPNMQAAVTKKLKKLPETIFIEKEAVSFSEEAAIKNYQEPFLLTAKCEIIFDNTDMKKNKQKIQIILPPRNAFGTGTHISTRLAAKMLEKYTNKNSRLLDVGTGTGILAIYAAKRGMQNIIATDSDPIAITEAQQLLKLNAVAEMITVKQMNFADELQLRDFTRIVANLSLNLYKKFLPQIKDAMNAKQGYIFSGIIEAERKKFEQLLSENNLVIKDKIVEGGWVAYYAKR